MNDLKKWLRIRKDLYLQVARQVRHRLGEDTEELALYRKFYDKEFSKKWTVASKEHLWAQIEKSQVVMVGDFHPLHQSQKAQVRILRHLPKERKVTLAVEFFESADQEYVNAYLAGKLSERDFLKAIRWQTRWGFPWENYRPIMRWAQKHKVSVHGLNKSYKKRTAMALKSRDIFAGKKIADIVRKHPQHLVFVIYGDLHLAKEHIPEEVLRHLGPSFEKKILRVFQNSEQIYFQLLAREVEDTTDLVRISKNVFCLMSVPPWVKWQNYLMYLEQTYDKGLSGDDDDDEVLDYTDHVSRYVQIIADELGLKVSTSGLSVYTAQDKSFWLQVREAYQGEPLSWVENMIADGFSIYLPEIKAAFLARGTVNHAASLAMRYIHAEISGSGRFLCHLPEDFLGLIWSEAVAYFGSKIINHKRKTDTIADIKLSLASHSPNDMGKEPLQLALAQKMHELMMITGVVNHQLHAHPRRKWSYFLAANLLGGMLGERLYSGSQKKLVSSATVLSFLNKNVELENFKVAYYDMIEVIESLPASFHSKSEKL